MEIPKKYKMNSASGKEILALVREADFAHPGEAEAVRLCLAHLKPRSKRKILDIGCGRGGTAGLIHELGLGEVTGIDTDKEGIEYARTHYSRCKFHYGDALNLADCGDNTFNLIMFFSVLYCLKDQLLALKEAFRLSQAAGELIIFDYSDPNAIFHSKCPNTFSYWQPLSKDLLMANLSQIGWKIKCYKKLDKRFIKWYKVLFAKIELRQNEIETRFSKG